jgi:hypothetical protein
VVTIGPVQQNVPDTVPPMPDIEPLKLMIEVSAGVTLGSRDPLYSKVFSLKASEYEKHGKAAIKKVEKAARDYVDDIRDPERVNWVSEDWVWL